MFRKPLESLGRIGQMKATLESAGGKAASRPHRGSDEEEVPAETQFLAYHISKGTFDDPCFETPISAGDRESRLASRDVRHGNAAYPDARFINGQFLAG